MKAFFFQSHHTRILRSLARHFLVSATIFTITFSGSVVPFAAATGPTPPSPLSVQERSVTTDPAAFYLPSSAESDGGQVTPEGFWEHIASTAHVVEPAPVILPQGKFVPYRIWQYADSVAVEFPGRDGSQIVRFASTAASYELFQRPAGANEYLMLATQELAFQYRNEVPGPTPTVSAEPTPEPSPGDTPEIIPEATSTPEPTGEVTPESTPEATSTPEPTVQATPEPTLESTPEPTPEATVEVPSASLWERLVPTAHADEPFLYLWEDAVIDGVTTQYTTTTDSVVVNQHFTVHIGDATYPGFANVTIGFGANPINKWTYGIQGESSVPFRVRTRTTFAAQAERVTSATTSAYTLRMDPGAMEQWQPNPEVIPETASASLWGKLQGIFTDLFSSNEKTFLVRLAFDPTSTPNEEYTDGVSTAIFEQQGTPPEGYALYIDPEFGAEQNVQGITVQSGDGTSPADFKVHFNPALGGAIDQLYQGGDFSTNHVALPASSSGGLTLVNVAGVPQAQQVGVLTILERSSVRVVVQNELPGLTERYAVYPSGRIAKTVVIDTPEQGTADFFLNGDTDAFDAQAAHADTGVQVLTGSGPDVLLAWQDPQALASASYDSGMVGMSRTTTVSLPLDAGQHTFYQLIELSQTNISLTDPASYLRFAEDYHSPDEPAMTRGSYLGFSAARAAYQFEAVNNVVVFRLNGFLIPRIDPTFEVSSWSDPDLTAFKAQLNGQNLVEGVDYTIDFQNADPSTGLLLFQYLHTVQSGDRFNVAGDEDAPALFDLDPNDAAAIKNVQRGTATFTATQNQVTVTLPSPVVTSRSFVFGGTGWGGGSTSSSNANASRITYYLKSPTELLLIRNGTLSGNTATASWQVAEFEDNSGALVQRGSVSFATGDSTKAATLPSSVTTNKAFALVSVTTDSTSQIIDEEWTIRASLSATTLTMDRNESGIAVDVAWQVIQLDGISVQRGLTSLSGATTTNVTISSVNTNKSFVVYSAMGAAGTNGIDAQYETLLNLTSATNLRIKRTSATNGVDVAWFVVTFTGTSGQRTRAGINTFAAAAVDGTGTLSPAVISTRSFAFASADGGTTGTDNLDDDSFYTTLDSTTSLGIHRDGSAAGVAASVSWFVTEFTRPAIQQSRYIWRHDNGTEVTAVSMAAQNASVSLNVGVTKRLRFGLYNSDSGSATSQFRLEFTRKLAGGTCGPTTGKVVVSAAGSSTFVVPTGVTSLTVKAWGAGGGGGAGGSLGVGGAGGGAGFAQGTITVTPGESLNVVVGGGGGGGAANTNSGDGGGGGGRSSVFRSATPLILAGGGAGGGGGDNSAATAGGAGGAGGGTSGVTGGTSGTANGGGGGTSGAGGAGGTNASGAAGGAGASLAGGGGGTAAGGAGTCGSGTPGGGGAAGSGGGAAGGIGDVPAGCSGGGGGAGGLFGGGGGSPSSATNAGGGGGGGGSGTVTGTSTTLTAGSGTTPANNGDSDYVANAGVGGAGGAATPAAGTVGNAGRVVIAYVIPEGLSPGWTWRQVPVSPSGASDSFDIEDSPNLTDGSATTNVAGLLTDDDTVFVAGEVKDTGNQTSSIGLASTSFTEIEFSLQPNSNATLGAKYCFRVTDAGEDRASHSFIYYPMYAEAQVNTTFTPDPGQNAMRWYSPLNEYTPVDPWSPGIVTVSSSSFAAAGTSTFTVPAGVTNVTVKVWGAGGGGGEGAGGTGVGGAGGGGGFATAILSVTPAEDLTIDVGTGGTANAGTQGGGNGGGYSTVRRSATKLVQAGGGGGGGASDTGSGEGGGAGGAGGGTSGVAGGDNGLGVAGGGGGGTQSAGGAGGNAGGAGTNGTAGAANAGGNGGAAGTGGAGGTGGGGLAAASANGGGGGGGGGKFGGGGGENGDTTFEGGGGGGGGSSGFDAGVTASSSTAGSGVTPGSNTDRDYGGTAGIGGAGSAAAGGAVAGNPGRVVVIYTTVTNTGSADMPENDALIYAHWASPGQGTKIRLRMSILAGVSGIAVNGLKLKLQFAEIPVGGLDCTAVASWTDVGASTSSEVWRFGSNTALTDHTTVPTLLLSTSDTRGSYVESNPTASNSFAVPANGDIEYDFSLQNNTANTGSRYCFRAINNSGTPLVSYIRYPSIITPLTEADQSVLMRHGEFFSDQGIKQPYYWAEIR